VHYSDGDQECIYYVVGNVSLTALQTSNWIHYTRS